MKCPVCKKEIKEPHFCKHCNDRVAVPLDDDETPFDKAMHTVGKLYEQKNFLLDFISQEQKREGELLANVLKAFDKHKANTLKDLEVLKHNLHVHRVIK